MALTPKAPNGQLIPAAAGDLYTAGAFTAIFPPRALVVVNNNAGASRVFNLYTRTDGANDFRITGKDEFLEAGGKWYNPGPIFLETGDKLRGDATGGGADVSLVIAVLEKT